MPKLNYKIIGRTTTKVGEHLIDCVAVEWTHDDGPVTDTVLLPTSHPPIHPSMGEMKFEAVPDGQRDVIHDQINVPSGTPDSIVMQACEEKRARLAANLGVDP